MDSQDSANDSQKASQLDNQDQPKSKLVWYLLFILVVALVGAIYWYYQTQVAGVSKDVISSGEENTKISNSAPFKEGFISQGMVLLPEGRTEEKANQRGSGQPQEANSVNQTKDSGSDGAAQGNWPGNSCQPKTNLYLLQFADRVYMNLEPVTKFNSNPTVGKLTNTISVDFAVPAAADQSTKPDRLYLTMHKFSMDYFGQTTSPDIDEVTGNTAALMTQVPIEKKKTDALEIFVLKTRINYLNEDFDLYCVTVTFKDPDLKTLTRGQIPDGSNVVLAAHFTKNQKLYPVLFGYYEPKSVSGQAIYAGYNMAVGHAFKPFSYNLWLNAQVTVHLKEDPQ